jgi:hypothetical protein
MTLFKLLFWVEGFTIEFNHLNNYPVLLGII